jgi:CobQ-like glutamine amidotransferase family enzyme
MMAVYTRQLGITTDEHQAFVPVCAVVKRLGQSFEETGLRLHGTGLVLGD